MLNLYGLLHGKFLLPYIGRLDRPCGAGNAGRIPGPQFYLGELLFLGRREWVEREFDAKGRVVGDLRIGQAKFAQLGRDIGAVQPRNQGRLERCRLAVHRNGQARGLAVIRTGDLFRRRVFRQGERNGFLERHGRFVEEFIIGTHRRPTDVEDLFLEGDAIGIVEHDPAYGHALHALGRVCHDG